MRMKLNQYHGVDLDSCWLHVVETRVSGFGKVGLEKMRTWDGILESRKMPKF